MPIYKRKLGIKFYKFLIIFSQWNIEKSQEYSSTNYLKTINETIRLAKSQEKYEYLEQRYFLERQRLQHDFLQKFQSRTPVAVKRNNIEEMIRKIFSSPVSPLERISQM